ncbi:ATP-dependent endonuclease [Bacteroidales bacterium]|nr:ATP-dependent endonuclease [Bacteroidales bacterium]
MINDYFSEQIKRNFPHEPTSEQEECILKLSAFLFDTKNESLFVLKGYAGTGKSSLLGAVVKTMTELQQKSVLLAPTGRAAKVFASYSGQNAFTIHKKIYRQKAFSNEQSGFAPADNLHTNTLFIVDEASMISNDGFDSHSFGSGRLLDDLIHYVYSGEGCRLLLMGDSAQLPPVSQSNSPALEIDMLQSYGMNIHSMVLTQVVRQAAISGILQNATQLRMSLLKNKVLTFPQLITKNLADVKVVRGDELIECIEDAYSRDGIEETIIITRSNKQANIFNNGIRNRILDREEELSAGDLLMVAKNNYFWGKSNEKKRDNTQTNEAGIDFIANGDVVEVQKVRKTQEIYGFRFCDVCLRFPDYDLEMEAKILLETLQSESPALSKEMNDKLFYTILEDYADIGVQRERMRKMKADPYYNVLQVKYAYAITCHKAQGGQWKNVFLDLSYVPKEYLGVDFYRWLYTAFTRATERIFLINPAKEMIEN